MEDTDTGIAFEGYPDGNKRSIKYLKDKIMHHNHMLDLNQDIVHGFGTILFH